MITLLSVVFLVPKLTKTREVKVPDVSELTVSKATEKLEKLGLIVRSKVEVVDSDTIKKGRVVKSDPAKGKTVKKGSRITIYKSSGEKTYTLEDYKGKNYIEVQTILETKYKLVVTVEKKDVENSDYDDQEIIDQSLPAKSEVKEGDAITLYIPNLVDKFPDMVASGYSYDDVAAFCKKYNLELKVNYVETEQYAEGKVISQSRVAGTEIVKETTLTIEVAKKPTEKKEQTKPTTEDTKTKEDETTTENTDTE